ncbi:hypothetical protein DPMN_050983 [Dreissena polymorpha]|uniref:Uncharacterized protein n=1 Tax=Dreissena polymorpha TaxID=45954 RepID=A0A9D4CIX5_DREPO|nr:hypothetical protein DPMN_050983 [Dreissena polymorpha]
MFPQTRRTQTVVECSVNHGDDQSRHLFKLLDYVGYSHDIIAERRRVFHGIDAMMNNAKKDKIVQVTAGSKAEGFASCFESDYDYLNIYQNIVCQFEFFCKYVFKYNNRVLHVRGSMPPRTLHTEVVNKRC